jgi:hypothetical protein
MEMALIVTNKIPNKITLAPKPYAQFFNFVSPYPIFGFVLQQGTFSGFFEYMYEMISRKVAKYVLIEPTSNLRRRL